MPKKPMTTDDLARLMAAGFRDVDKRFREIAKTMATKADLAALATKADVATEIRSLRTDMDGSFKDVKATLAELKASSRVLDTLLERFLVQRVQRIEEYLKLAPYVPELEDDMRN